MLVVFLLAVASALTVPYEVACPEYSLVRNGTMGLCHKELHYLSKKSRLKHVQLDEILARTQVGANSSVVHRYLPRVAIALSGGGYRSMLLSTGFLRGLDAMGLYHYSDYIAGISGGSWSVMDLVVNKFQLGKLISGWDLSTSMLPGMPDVDIGDDDTDFISDMHLDHLLQPNIATQKRSLFKRDNVVPSPLLKIKQILFPNNTLASEKLFEKLSKFKNALQFYIDLHLHIRSKRINGFPISFTDYWAQALVQNIKYRQLPTHLTYSKSVRTSNYFKNYLVPIPIIVANCRNGFLKNVIFEFTPWEFGSWEQVLGLFVNIEYLGSRIINGVSHQCYKGLDDLGFIAATSSSIFNNALIYVWKLASKSSKDAIAAVKTVLAVFGLGTTKFESALQTSSQITAALDTDYAVYRHNPFYKYSNIQNELAQNDYLYLVDGGEDGENIPIRTLVPRNVDMIMIMDSSSDKKNYANGDKLKIVLNQMKEKEGIYYKYPTKIVTSQKRPTVIGCKLPRTSDTKLAPILVYYPNSERSSTQVTNTSTFKMIYTSEEQQLLIDHGYNLVTGHGEHDYQKCMACILVKRSYDQASIIPPKQCSICYSKYCDS